MSDSYRELFRHLKYREPRIELTEAILGRISSAHLRLVRYKLFFASFLSLGTLATLFLVLRFTVTEFSHSDFYHFLTLIFSDGAALFMYWKEFTLSLVLSLPMLGITLSLLVTFIFLVSFSIVLKNLSVVTASRKLITS